MSALSRAQRAVAIDGPAGSGKSSVARRIAKELGLAHVDTGAMYRAITLLALREQLDLNSGAPLAARLAKMNFRFESGRLLLDGTDVETEIRGEQVTASVSTVAAHSEVRGEMLHRQRALAAAAENGCVLEGRDIGSTVLPLAQRKIFLFADGAERARRRAKQLELALDGETLARLESEISERDEQDRSREASPLRISPDAHVVDTTHIDEDATVAHCLQLLDESQFDPPEKSDLAPFERHGPLYMAGLRCVSRPLIKGLWGMRVFGRENTHVAGSVIFACNHISGFDPVVAGTAVDREVYYLAKKELFTPLLGPIIRRFNSIPIERRRYDGVAFQEAERVLQEGKDLMIFPEGTRRPPGRPGPVKKGLGLLALRSGRPFLAVLLRGTASMAESFRHRGSLQAWIGPPVVLRAADSIRLDCTEAQLQQRIGALCLEQLRALSELAEAHADRP